MKWEEGKQDFMSLMKILKSNDDKWSPWATPHITSIKRKLPIFTICFLPKRKDPIQDKRDPYMPYERNLCNKIEWPTLTNALEKLV